MKKEDENVYNANYDMDIEDMKDIEECFDLVKALYYVLVGYVILDFVCYCAWALTVQIPEAGFYFGWFTENAIKFFT